MTGWTDERVALLTKLWTEGLSAAQISKQLGGVTRNAALGKLHRLGLLGTRAKPSKPSKPAKLFRPPRPVLVRPAPSSVPLPTLREVEAGPGKPWIERAFGECAYPLRGDGADTVSCCAKVRATTPYCPAHYQLMFVPPKKLPKADHLTGETRARRRAA